MLTEFLKSVFGTKSQRDVKRMRPIVKKINEIELTLQSLTEEQLQGKTDEFKQRLANGETTEDIMCEAFAVVKNACRRLCGRQVEVCGQSMEWNMIPFDVQIMGGIALHRGNIAEMATGEGKTLVATMPLYLNALTGRNCQLVTVNDYLARRDSEWMGTVYRYLGLTVGCLQNSMSSNERRAQYACDITYGTNSEFGFDYLRDMGMAKTKEQLVQRDYFYAIVDEIDSILVDEARTPLIISGPVPSSSHKFDEINPLVRDLFEKQHRLCTQLISEAREILDNPNATKEMKEEAMTKALQVKFGLPTHKQLMRMLEDVNFLKALEKLEMNVRSDSNRGMQQEVQSILYFVIDEKQHDADLTEKGRLAISPNDPEAFIMPDLLMGIHDIDNDPALSEDERIAKREEFEKDYSEKSERLHDLSQLLKAYCLFERDVHYMVQDGKVLIIDEHTGRAMPGRRFSDGLHQALEAKEMVEIEQETQTFATITIQNYFRMYDKLAGMTGTAETEATEFHQIYKLDVIVIPTNRPCRRVDENDSIFKSKREKFNAIVEDVARRHEKLQPVLVGTISVEDSEILSRMLKRKGIPHNVLNAKNHQYEAEIVAQAGQPGAVTVATNMAGRGTDIKLGGEAAALGLHVIGSSRHDSRRIDRQLRGRCSRQGDPGSSKFYVSLEDNLMRLFGSDRIIKIFERFGLEEGEELQHPFLNRSIETAQRRVEQQHFAIRKRTLEFDDVMNKQREVIYGIRRQALCSDTPEDALFGLVDELIGNEISTVSAEESKGSITFNKEQLAARLNHILPMQFKAEDFTEGFNKNGKLTEPDMLGLQISAKIEAAYLEKNKHIPPDQLINVQRRIVLDAIDRLWMEHLYRMDQIRSSIYLRVYAQKDPLIEYKNEAFKAFEELMNNLQQSVTKSLFANYFPTPDDIADIINSLPEELRAQLTDFELVTAPDGTLALKASRQTQGA